uniref:Uncharacterized protein n=1 Tax=Anguilla anguilla TaxID=7936 RepID=A0A0E9RBY4_ANGAN
MGPGSLTQARANRYPYTDSWIKGEFLYGENEWRFHITVPDTVCDLKWDLKLACFYPHIFLS